MTILVHIAMMMWVPAAVALFLLLPGRRALIVGAAASWMLLPVYKYYPSGLPDIDKVSIAAIGLLLGAAIFDWRRIVEFRPSWLDVPMLVWCVVSPIASAMSNSEFIFDRVNLYDGISHTLDQFIHWGAFYFLGRLYLTDLAAMREAALGLIIASLLYVPFILYEWRMSPQLHRHVYGYFPHMFSQHIRYGGWRPLVFLEHGLLLVQWLTSALIAAIWLWHTRTVLKVWRLPMIGAIVVLLGMVVVCKTLFAAVLLPAGVAVLWLAGRTRSSWPVIAVLSIALGYVVVRSTGMWDGQQLIEWSAKLGEEKERSIRIRIETENQLSERAMERPVLGWGRWGRWRIYDDQGVDRTLSDGGWLIALGQLGQLGLVSYFAMFGTPILAFLRRYPPAVWRHPSVAAAAAMAVIVLMGMVYNIPNSSLNPYITMSLGGIATLATVKAVVRQPAPARVRRRPQPAERAAGTLSS